MEWQETVSLLGKHIKGISSLGVLHCGIFSSSSHCEQDHA